MGSNFRCHTLGTLDLENLLGGLVMRFCSQESLQVTLGLFVRFFFAILVTELSRRKRGCFFEESAELLLFFYKQTWLMARYNVEDVLDIVWNDSGSKGSISDSDHTPGNSNSDGESEEWSGNSAETSESSDTASGNESEESDICYAAFLQQF